jgi:cAMP-specific phosphodiesterase 4
MCLKTGRHLLGRWADRVLEEFFLQGDRERAQGLPVSPLMDRYTTSLSISQINFCEFVVAPLFHQVSKVSSLVTNHL